MTLAKKPRKKPKTSKTAKWIIIFLAFGTAIIGWWFWSCTYNVSPRFNYLLITKNGESLRLLNREVLRLHPGDKLKILEVFTNVCLNRGVRLVATDLCNCHRELQQWYPIKVNDMIYDYKLQKIRYRTPPEMVKEYHSVFNGFIKYKEEQKKTT